MPTRKKFLLKNINDIRKNINDTWWVSNESPPSTNKEEYNINKIDGNSVNFLKILFEINKIKKDIKKIIKNDKNFIKKIFLPKKKIEKQNGKNAIGGFASLKVS